MEAYGSPEKGWLLNVDMLAVHLFDIAAIFAMTTSRKWRKEQQVQRMKASDI